jgi:hypothetical protein
MSKLLTALTNKGYSKEEAEEIISNMREDVLAGADPEELLYEEGLEPDYIMDLIDF